MIFDIHVHIAGTGFSSTGNLITPAFKKRLGFRMLARKFGLSPEGRDQLDLDGRMRDQLLAWLQESKVDRAVFLALDAPYQRDGTRDMDHALMVTSNDFVADIADAHSKVLFGASIHPYRKNGLKELERVIARGACLLKWLPGAQNIQPDDPLCFPFYEILARHRVPLLSHTGPEHVLKAFPNSLNDPRRLIPALERGVTVFAAHCGTRIMLHEKSWFAAWREMALKHENFYGDISAFALPVRAWSLRSILRDPVLSAKLVYGSDFPVIAMPLSFIGHVGIRRLIQLGRIRNPFDQGIELLKAAGVPEEVFARAENLLRLPRTI
jgi:predicted TIM-barrel fold metal-dependent hydrolase